MTFWGPQMTELLRRARHLPGYREDFPPVEFARWLNHALDTDVSENIDTELAAKQWLEKLNG